MYHQHTFESGLRLITAPNEGTKAVTLLILVGAGSRNEEQHERGISHFLEHMFFKGGERFTNAKEVSETIDAIGGDFNAFTGKEYAGYYVKCASESVEIAFDVLSDMLMNATFPTHEIEKERGVILQEMNMYEDTPTYKIGWDFEQLLFGAHHPMGWDQIGTKELITTVTQEQFESYRSALYSPENTVIIASGNITPENAREMTAKFFPIPKGTRTRHHVGFQWQNMEQKIHIRHKKTEQAHIVMGYPGLPVGHPDEYAKKLLAVILGGNMSSRMFLNIREAHGLCYSISTTTDCYTDCGTVSTHAGVDIPRVNQAIYAIRKEYESAAREGITASELEKAKSFLKGKITLRMEDSEEVASFLGTQALLRSNMKTLEELFAQIDALTVENVSRVAHELFDPQKLALAAIGPFEGKESEFEQILRG